jgi:hypothetical protein
MKVTFYKGSVLFLMTIFTLNIILTLMLITPSLADAQVTNPVNISNKPGESVVHQILTPNDDVLILWEEQYPSATNQTYELYFTHSNDLGNTYESYLLSKHVNSHDDASFVISNSSVYVAWRNQSWIGGGEGGLFGSIYVTYSNDLGKTFAAPLKISGDIHSINPKLSLSNDEVYLSWSGKLNNNWEVFISKYKPSENNNLTNLTKLS